VIHIKKIAKGKKLKIIEENNQTVAFPAVQVVVQKFIEKVNLKGSDS
jgi:hypothetical protein